MNYPFRINYKNEIAESIEYMNKDSSKREEKSVLEFLCDLINSKDPYHLYYLYNRGGKKSEAEDILSFAVHLKNNKKKTKYTKDDLLSNPNFRESFFIHPLSSDWLDNKRLYELTKRFQDEIFSFDVKYNPASGSLMFINDLFHLNNTKKFSSHSLAKLNYDLIYNSPDDIDYLSLLFAYSPFQYQIYRRFDVLCEELRCELQTQIHAKDDIFFSLYRQSKEFVLLHLEFLLKKYYPTSIVQNSYQIQKNNLSTLINGIPTSVEKPGGLNSPYNYTPTISDYLLSYTKAYQKEILRLFVESLKEDDYCTIKVTELQQSNESIKLNNKIINKLYTDNTDNEYMTGIDYCLSTESSTPTININKMTYTNIITRKESVVDNAPIQLSLPMPFYYDIDSGNYISDNASLLSIIYNDISNPLFMSIFSSPEIDIKSLLQIIDKEYHLNLYNTLTNAYDNSGFSKAPYIETDSLGMVLSEVLRSYNSSDTSSIKRCSECHKFFVTRNGLDKYCDSVNRPINSSPKIGTCSYIAKQRKEKERDNCIRKIYNLKRNQLARLEEQNNNYVIRDKYEEYLYNIQFQYEEFIFFLKKNILRNYLFDKERFYIYRTLSITDSETEQKELIDYARSFFPTKRNFDKEEHHTIPTSNNHISYFYNNEKNSYLDNTHIYTFDWSEMIAKIINGQDYYHKGYIAFRNMVARTLDKNRQAFDSLDDDIICSFEYISNLDDKWRDIVNRINITNSELQKKSMHR